MHNLPNLLNPKAAITIARNGGLCSQDGTVVAPCKHPDAMFDAKSDISTEQTNSDVEDVSWSS
jgi:hypothetical protein